MLSIRRSVCAVTLLLATTACQRIPDEGGPITSAGGGGGDTGGTFGPGTFGTADPTNNPADGSDVGDDEGGGEPPCDPVEQSGCNDAERCTVVGSDDGEPTFGCVSDSGALQPFDACTADAAGQDGCPAGHACVADIAGEGACMPLCATSNDCDLGSCTTSTFGVIPYCADDCSPFEPLCAAPTQCRRNGERFSCRVPQESDVGGAGSPCIQLDDGGCTSGLICVPGALVPDCTEQNCCAPLCDVDELGACASPATCSPALEAPAPGFESIGACFVPA